MPGRSHGKEDGAEAGPASELPGAVGDDEEESSAAPADVLDLELRQADGALRQRAQRDALA